MDPETNTSYVKPEDAAQFITVSSAQDLKEHHSHFQFVLSYTHYHCILVLCDYGHEILNSPFDVSFKTIRNDVNIPLPHNNTNAYHIISNYIKYHNISPFHATCN